jgi:SAM-dependent methyltransferase
MIVGDVERRVLELTAGEADPAFRRRAAWALSRLDLAAGQRVLEVGAGIAPLLVLAQRLARLRGVAVDVDLRRLAAARRRSCGDVVAASAVALPFRSGTFDRALACEVLEHLDDDGAAIAELGRVVAGHGLVAVTVPHQRYPASWDPLARLLDGLGVQPPRSGPYVGIWYGHRRLYGREGLRTLAESAGWLVREEAELVRGGFPFAHFLLYGVGRWLLEAGLVRGQLAAAVGRSAEGGPPLPARHPVGLAIRVLRRCEARAERRGGARSVHLGLLLTPGVRRRDRGPGVGVGGQGRTENGTTARVEGR